MKIQLITAVAALWSCHVAGAVEPDPDIALKPAHVIINPWRFHIPPTKRQGVPGIERTAKGRLWVIHGRDVESPRNYQVLIRSDSDGGVDAAIPQFVFGGAGKDKIKGGRGNDVLIGGAGKDDLKGSNGDDILIGGDGKDKLKGGRGDDLLVGGIAENEDDLDALDAAMSDWESGDLAGALDNLGIILDDGLKDNLKGEKGIDVLIDGVGDKLKQK